MKAQIAEVSVVPRLVKAQVSLQERIPGSLFENQKKENLQCKGCKHFQSSSRVQEIFYVSLNQLFFKM